MKCPFLLFFLQLNNILYKESFRRDVFVFIYFVVFAVETQSLIERKTRLESDATRRNDRAYRKMLPIQLAYLHTGCQTRSRFNSHENVNECQFGIPVAVCAEEKLPSTWPTTHADSSSRCDHDQLNRCHTILHCDFYLTRCQPELISRRCQF